MTLFDEVKRAFNAPLPPDQVGLQKRIVIEGLGGSGKTQFCCKYASFCRQRYVIRLGSIAVNLAWLLIFTSQLLGNILDQRWL